MLPLEFQWKWTIRIKCMGYVCYEFFKCFCPFMQHILGGAEKKPNHQKILFYPMTWDVPSISGRSCKNKVMLTFIVRLNSYILHAASMPKSRIICIVGEFAPWFQVQMHHIQIILNIHKDVNLHFNAHTSCALQTFPYGGFLLPQRE